MSSTSTSPGVEMLLLIFRVPRKHVLDSRIPQGKGDFFWGGGRLTWECPGVSTVKVFNILNVFRKEAAAMRPPFYASTVAVCCYYRSGE